jgi:hypothetical protein
MSKPIKYVAAIEHVREVTLRGTADYAFWQDCLACYELTPVDRNGRARILIIAASMRYMGIQFTEVTFSVEVVPPGEYQQSDAGFLIHAFNTSRMFAFSERIFFGTPYYHADCRLSTSSPISMEVADADHTTFHATTKSSIAADATNRAPTGRAVETWEGPIFLPAKPNSTSQKRYVFFAKLHGIADVHPFRPDLDSISIAPSRNAAVFQNLIDSDFVGEEWSVKTDATHARSRTYPRK